MHNNSQIFIGDIEIGDSALSCFSRNTYCCRSIDSPSGIEAIGRWQFPNKSPVGIRVGTSGFSVSRENGSISLQRHGALAPTGQFCCSIPIILSTEQRACVVISKCCVFVCCMLYM